MDFKTNGWFNQYGIKICQGSTIQLISVYFTFVERVYLLLLQINSVMNKFTRSKLRIKEYILLFLLIVVLVPESQAQRRSIFDRLRTFEQTMDISNRSVHSTSDFSLEVLKESQTAAVLSPKIDPEFDFLPSELLETRSRDSLYHLGDINLMIRTSDSESWESFTSAYNRVPVQALSIGENELSAALLNSTMGENLPINLERRWKTSDGDLILSFILKNASDQEFEIGHLGVPMVFDNILHEKNLEEAHLEKVFYDPYIGEDGGYLQVLRLSGKSPALLVLPHKNAGFEAYNPLLDDRTPRGITFEGFHEWVVYSKAKAEGEWSEAKQWNEPSSFILKPGDEHEVAFRFVLADEFREIEKTLLAEDRPLAVGFPGYVLPQDVEAKLFISNHKKIKDITVFPEGSINLKKGKNTVSGNWTSYALKGNVWGRSRLEVSYESGEIQTIHYKVIKPETAVVDDLGRFLTTEQWYENPSDPFGRDQSVISYDYDKKEKVVEDNRAWIAGLSDEGGAGSWLAAMMKQFLDPDPIEMQKLSKFYYQTLWGGIQYNVGEKKYGVRKSMYYYEPDKMPEGTYSDKTNFKTWSAWPQKEAESTGRSYNYPHVAAAHWVMYRLSRFHEGLAEQNPWSWYLDNAYQTAVAMVDQAPHYAQFGQMEGSVFLYILQDLKREGMKESADKLEEIMRKRTDVWVELAYPFGSEMPWDSTGQEEVYSWTNYFGFNEKANVTLNAILAYMPTVPHWGYNGSARRYWDFLYGGKIRRVERQLHHYGSALNAIPVLEAYHQQPEDLYMLRVGYGGLLGGISHITPEGFAPAAFHSFPSTLDIDGLSGDYGSGFYGYAVNSRSYLVDHEEFGWVGFGGNVSSKNNWVEINLTTAGKNALYIEPLATLVELDAGKITKALINKQTGEVHLELDKATEHTKQAVMRVSSYDSDHSIKAVDYVPASDNRYWIDLKEDTLLVKLK